MAQDPLDIRHLLWGMPSRCRCYKLSYSSLAYASVGPHATFLEESRESFSNGISVE